MKMCINQILKVRFFIFFIYTLFLTSSNLAQIEGYLDCVPEETGTLSVQAIQPGGRYIPSQDTFHVLIVFVQFPDDSFDIYNPMWPKGEPPAYLNTFIDSVASQNSTNGNMSHYFRDMSMGTFHLTGQAVHVFTPQTRRWYKDNYGTQLQPYRFINRDVLLRVDSMMSFEPFDRWIRGTNYIHDKGQDEIIDMVIMSYRNVAIDSSQYLSLVHGGTATLGGGSDLYVDGGLRRLKMGWPGSGITSVVSQSTDGSTLNNPPYRVSIHEIAHFFFGGNSWHNGAGYWSLFGGDRLNSVRQGCANSLERELLGWIEPDSLYQYTFSKILTDFATTGSSVKIKVPGSNPNEYFRLEYHSRVSQFDTPEMHDPNAKGLYILHQTGLGSPENGWMYLLPADGKWTWIADEVQYPDYYPTGLAVYEKSGIDRINGYDDSRRVPFTWVGPPPSPNVPNPSWIHFYRDRVTNQLIQKTIFSGDGKDAWGHTKNNLFSPWSNPRSQNNAKEQTWISIEITYEQSSYIRFNVRFDSTSAQALRPSKPQDCLVSWSGTHPQITWSTNLEPDMQSYKIWRNGGSSGGGIIATVTHNSGLTTYSYIDNAVTKPGKFDPTFVYTYKVKAIDNTNKESLYSNEASITGLDNMQWKISNDNKDEIISDYFLSSNYPNPFNPSTVIRYSVKESGLVSLKVFDLLGKEVAVLINEVQPTGVYEAKFNSLDLPSGIYIYSLRVNDFADNQKMLLLK